MPHTTATGFRRRRIHASATGLSERAGRFSVAVCWAMMVGDGTNGNYGKNGNYRTNVTCLPLGAGADARVYYAVEQIYGEIYQYVRAGDQKRHPLDDRVIAVPDRLDRDIADARHVEKRLHDERPGEQRAEVGSKDRKHGKQCVLDAVP